MNDPKNNPASLLHVHPEPEHERDAFNEVVDGLRLVNPRKVEFMNLSRRVCLISRTRAPDATGFLVAPDLILTAAHALLGTSSIFADPDDVTILFDQFLWNVKKGTPAKGDSCGLRRIPFTNQPDVV